MHHTFKEETLDYHIIYKRRKTITIEIDQYGGIRVIAPRDTKDEVIHKMLELHWEQLQDKIKEMRQRSNGSMEKAYDNGEKFLYLGKEYTITVQQKEDISKDKVEISDHQFMVYVKELEEENIQKALKRFYYQKCKALVEKRVNFYQNQFKDRPRSISIADDQKTWGTCNSRRELTFNWRLAMAPLEVIDYVVVHEMCHMVHLNHDRSFWRLVGKMIPDYERKQNWLAVSNWKMTV